MMRVHDVLEVMFDSPAMSIAYPRQLLTAGVGD
jgi:hypothetical protein